MSFFPVMSSENELVKCPEPELATFANEECAEFYKDWTPFTVESEVTRGKHLRECKPSSPHHDEIQIGVDFVRPCAEKKRSFRKCSQRPCYEIYNSPCLPCGPPSPPCGCCPQTSTNARSKSCKRSKPSLPHHKQCPLRIMELAAPTKRHCLDTWRSKSHVLPDIMVDRVRQYVMDEKPLVEIPDAINCFKRRVSNKSCKKSCKPRMSNGCMTDMRKYSAIFAYCVSQKLDKPLNIILNPELEKISKVISYEISSVTKKNKKSNKSKKNKFDKKMQDEISKKVTAWIDNVLVDSSGKLLEDDLNELEEKEGPVLDIIDDLIDNVVDSCEPPEEYNSGNITGNESEADVKSKKSESYTRILTSGETDSKDAEGGEGGEGSEGGEGGEADVNDISIENSDNELHQTELGVTESYTDIKIDNLHTPPDGFEAVHDGLDPENEDPTGETANVSETFKKYSEESLDAKNLTVKFSDIDPRVRGGLETNNRSLQNITFAPPNEHLLSNADEVWPADVPKVSEKLSTILSKSITSLGFLYEKDEKRVLSDGDSEKIINPGTKTPDGDKIISDATDVSKKIEVEEVEVQQTNLRDAYVDIDAGIGPQFELKKLKATIMGERKVDYKVDAKTAPSWVLTGGCDKGCGDSEDSIQEDTSKDDNEICQKPLRTWATNLEIMCANLQIWHDWIDISCKNIRHIKRKSERYKSSRTCTCRQKDIDCWLKLRRYIDKDSQFWLKFKHNEKRILKSYKWLYKHNAKHNRTTIDLDRCICEKY